MAIVKSNELVKAGQAVQREAVERLVAEGGTRPHMLIVRYFDPANPDHYRPTGSYAAQIRNHATEIGATTDQVVVVKGDGRNVEDVVARASQDPKITSIMPLYPLPDVHAMLRALDPAKDADDLHGTRNRAPTARAMLTMGSICLHSRNPVAGGADYFVGRTLDEVSRLHLPDSWRADDICMGGSGGLTGGPARRQLAAFSGIFVQDERIATRDTPERLVHLPAPAFVLTATPTAEQIRSENIAGGSIIIDAGFGIVDGKTFGNTDRRVADRRDVLWTPPTEGVGPVSTLFLWHHALEAAGVPPEHMPALGGIALSEAVMVG